MESPPIEKGTAMSNENAQPLRVLEGINSRLELYTDRVIIRRTATMSQLLPQIFGADKTILYDQIDSVRLYTSRFLTAGWIQFLIFGGPNDATSLVCSSKHFKLAHEIKEMIEDSKSRQKGESYLKTFLNKAR
jgi:hypothetical protein